MKTLIATLLTTTMLSSQEFAEYRERPILNESIDEKPFRYAVVGANAFIEGIAGEVGLGYRTINGEYPLVIDGCVGTTLRPEYQLLYVQGSLLLFPLPGRGPYLGAGVTAGMLYVGGDLSPWINYPLTLGCQWGERPKFFQIQVTPLGSLTASYGFNF